MCIITAKSSLFICFVLERGQHGKKAFFTV
uniref:Uncharacterized protein n=1 Tax=Anguilla anguilla TaxID=7936 RepID=A0A0E9SCC4_ANGAN